MKKTSNKTVFFGSGPVAAKSLELLLANFEIETVITKPSTVKTMASIAKGACVYSVNTKSELDALITAEGFETQLGILIDFGIIVSRQVIDAFDFGIVNSHFSLLPQWRGADPISFSILSGQEKTGVSLMLIDEGMDTGKILTQKVLHVNPNETTTTLTNRLIHLSNELLTEYVPRYIANEVKPRNQPHPDRATYSRKLQKEDGILDFSKQATALEREIRAFADWPKSRTDIAGKDVVVIKARADTSLSGKIGEVFKTNNKKIGIYTSKGALIVEELKPAGKQAMSAEGFLAGYGSNLDKR